MSTKRKKKKAPSKPRRGASRPRVVFGASDLYILAKVAFSDERIEEARNLLAACESLGPLSSEAVELYLEVLQRLRRHHDIARISANFAEQHPEDPEATFAAALGAFNAGQSISALVFFERFLTLAPNDARESFAKQAIKDLRDNLSESLKKFQGYDSADLSQIASVEKLAYLIQLHRFDDSIRFGLSHLKLYPDDFRVQNNIAECYFVKGDFKQALKWFDLALQKHPKSFYGLASRAQLYLFFNRKSECLSDAEKLTQLRPEALGEAFKAARLFAFLNDHEKVGWAYREVEQQGLLDDSKVALFLKHFYATSLAIAGDVKAAKVIWKEVTKKVPGGTTAEHNLQDQATKVGARWGYAYFTKEEFFSEKHFEQLAPILDALARRREEENGDGFEGGNSAGVKTDVPRLLRQFFQSHPEIEVMINLMLENGDSDCQRLAIELGLNGKSGLVREALVKYVQGPRGSDEIRVKLLHKLQQAGEVFPSPLRFYRQGEIREIVVLGFQITEDDPVSSIRSREVFALLKQGTAAIRAGDAVQAESLLRKARELDPDEPEVINNLAVSLDMQNREKEAEILLDEMIAKYPDLTPGLLAAARQKINAGKFSEALKILDHIQTKKSLQVTAFKQLVQLMVHANIGLENYSVAQQWLEIMRVHDPQSPQLSNLETRLAQLQSVGGILKRLRIRSFL